MLVFISWSGQRSKAIAEALETWLAQVIQAVEPWISQDIDKGLRWGAEIADRLERSKVGIICLTKSNLDARWIHFEAGALSKTKDAYVCTLLLDIKPSDVEQPLAQFQHTTTEKEDIFQLLSTINRAVQNSGEKALADPLLRRIFDTYWPDLEKAFQESATLQEATASPSRTTEEMLQEMLEILRNQERKQINSQYLTTNIDAMPLGMSWRESINMLRQKEKAFGIDAKEEKEFIDKYGLQYYLVVGYRINENYVRRGLKHSNSAAEFLDYMSKYAALSDAGRKAISLLYTLEDEQLKTAFELAKQAII